MQHAHGKLIPGRWALTLRRGCCPHLRAFERRATPRAARDLFGISLARLLIVEEHPSVLPTDPPHLPPNVYPLLARAMQCRHKLKPPSRLYNVPLQVASRSRALPL